VNDTTPYYRATLRLERVTPSPADSNGYIRTSEELLAELTLTGGSEENALRQASQHVGILVSTYTPVKVYAKAEAPKAEPWPVKAESPR